MANELVKPEQIQELITGYSQQFSATIAQYQWALVPGTQLNAAKQIILANEFLAKTAMNNPESLHMALLQSATLGLDLTPGKKQGWLLPRKAKDGRWGVCLQPGYKGVEAIAQNLGTIDRLVIRVVRDNDTFAWSGDDAEKPSHTAEWFAPIEQRGPIKGAYSITYFPGGDLQVITASIEDIFTKHRDRSDSWKSYMEKTAKGEKPYPPVWLTDEQSMVEKTMAFIAAKQWPANIRNNDVNSKILETLHDVDTQDYSFVTYNATQKAQFDEIIETNDSLGMYLLRQVAPIEVYSDLFNSFPKGQKTKMKGLCRDMEVEGLNLFNDAVAAIDSGDGAALAEALELSGELTVKLFKKAIGEPRLKAYNELV